MRKVFIILGKPVAENAPHNALGSNRSYDLIDGSFILHNVLANKSS